MRTTATCAAVALLATGAAGQFCEPELLAALDTESAGYGVDAVGSIVYLADRFNGLLLIDVSDAMAPEVVASVETHDAFDVRVVDGLAYVADEAQDLKIIDVSDPPTAKVIGALDLAGVQ